MLLQLVCWLSNMLHPVKQGCFPFLAFVVPSGPFFVSLHPSSQPLKKVELIMANSLRLTKTSVCTLIGSSRYNMLFAFLICKRHTCWELISDATQWLVNPSVRGTSGSLGDKWGNPHSWQVGTAADLPWQHATGFLGTSTGCGEQMLNTHQFL